MTDTQLCACAPYPCKMVHACSDTNPTEFYHQLKNVVIIGAGPTGVRATNKLLCLSQDVTVTLFNGESDKPYNRAQLSYYLAGDVQREQLDNPLPPSADRLLEHNNCHVSEVDTTLQCVIDESGNRHSYDELIIATGSRALSPNIPGRDKPHVYFFRDLNDVEQLRHCRDKRHSVFVIGSGPLGIETALAMKTPRNRVFLQVRKTLFSPLLDKDAKSVLTDFIRSNGIQIVGNAQVNAIYGRDHVRGVELSNGQRMDVDSVVICTGISPLATLAEEAGIEVNRGIVVDEKMRTNQQHVYAVGDCAESNGKTSGLLNPGYEQVDIAVSHILNSPPPKKGQSITADLHMKFRNFSSQILGDVSSDENILIHKNQLKNVYRKLFFKRRRMVGAIIIGEWSEAGSVANAILQRDRLPFNSRQRFIEKGNLWNQTNSSINDQPADYIVCLCKSVTRGEISECMKKGHRSLGALGKQLEAGVTCGSCQPLLKKMLNVPVENLIMRHYKSIFWASLTSIAMIILTFLAPKLPFKRSVQFAFQFEQIWYGSIYKQTTGYVLLVLLGLAGALSVRKRFKKARYGNLDNWRYAHTILGLITLLALVIHTGFRLGDNLNFVLMVVFLLATLTGSMVGVFMSRNHHWTDLKLTQYRLWWSRVHYSLLWLLPALLGFHILSSYYFA